MKYCWVLVFVGLTIAIVGWLRQHLLDSREARGVVSRSESQAASDRTLNRAVIGIGAAVLLAGLVWAYCEHNRSACLRRVVTGTMAGKKEDDNGVIAGYFDEDEPEVPVMPYPTAAVGETEALAMLIDMYPDADWDWKELSANSYITYDLVKKYSTKSWNGAGLVSSAGIDIHEATEIIRMDGNLRNDLETIRQRIFKNPNVTFDYVVNHPTFDMDGLEMALQSPSITIPEVLELIKRADRPPVIPGQAPGRIIQIHQDQMKRLRISATYNPNMTVADLVEHPELFYKYKTSRNRNLLFSDILKHQNLDWVWEELSSNPTIDVDYALEHIDLFSRYGLASNPMSSPKDANRLGLEMKYFHSNPNLTIQDIRSIPIESWDWGELGYNRGISLEDILANPDLPWKWGSITTRVKYADVLRHPEIKWDFKVLSESWRRPTGLKSLKRNWQEFVKQRDTPTLESRRAMTSFINELHEVPPGKHQALPEGGLYWQRLRRLMEGSVADLRSIQQRNDDERRQEELERGDSDAKEFPFQEEYESEPDEDTMPVFNTFNPHQPKLHSMHEPKSV